jgi:hypothetical protein
MSFLYDLADINYKTAVFYQSGSWIKPQGITMISITAIGAGGGGGGGATNTSANARSGGGGGGSGSITRLTIPEMFITDSLIINIGTGGNGGTAGLGNGTNGGNTIVDMPVPGNGDIYTRVITAPAGSGALGATGGLAASAADVTLALYSTLGIWMAIGGQGGGNGLTTAGTSVTYGATIGLPITSGAGGGGMAAASTTDSSGGTITGSGFVTTNPGGVGNTVTSGGTKGVYSLTPFYSLGGSGGGGGGNSPVSGGAGGDGNIGSGGGGGGGGTSPTGVGGVGGKGGDGLVIIQCW